MSVVVETIDVEVLRDKARRVSELITTFQAVSAARSPKELAGWYGELEDAVVALSETLPEGTEDYDARKLFEQLVVLRRAISADDSAADANGEVELASMMLGDVIGRISRRLEHDQLDDPRTAARTLFTTFHGVGVGDLSRLLGVSTKTIGAWRAGGPVTRRADRVVVLAQLVTYLRSSMTSVGLVMWFDAPRTQLGGRTPLELLDESVAAAREPLTSLARGTRGQLAG